MEASVLRRAGTLIEVCAGAQGLQPGSVLLHLLPFSACPMKPSSLPESRFA